MKQKMLQYVHLDSTIQKNALLRFTYQTSSDFT